MTSDKIPLIKVKGNHYEIGFQIGKTMKRQIRAIQDFPRILCEREHKLNYKYYLERSKKYFYFINNRMPHLISELKGMADGSNVDFDTLFLINCEAPLLDKFYEKCTSILVKSGKNWIFGHNEDFDYRFLNNTAIVQAQIEKGPSFMSFYTAGELPGTAISLNSEGILQGISSLDTKDYQLGIPNNFIAREILEATTTDEVINIIAENKRASAYNHMIIKDNAALEIETTARNYSVYPIKEKIYCHTNAYLNPNLKSFDSNPYKKISTKRRDRVINLMKTKSIKETLLDNSDKNNQILRNRIEGKEDIANIMTIATIIVDYNNKTFLVRKNIKNAKFYKYRFKF